MTCNPKHVRTCKTNIPASSLDKLVQDYIEKIRSIENENNEWYKNSSSFKKAILKAGKSIDRTGRMHPHQRRNGKERMEFFAKELANENSLNNIKTATDFDALYQLVKQVGETVHGIGELAVYDTSIRIGHYLGLRPQKVYLHNGAKKGFYRLVDLRYVKSTKNVNEVEKCVFPESMQRLDCDEIESFLCIYKEKFV